MAQRGQKGVRMRTSALLTVCAAASLSITPARILGQTRAIGANVYATFERSGTDTELIGLAVGDVPSGAKIILTCSGTVCPFTVKTFNIGNPAKIFALTDMFLDPTLPPGTVLEIRITKPGATGRVFQYETQSSANPRVSKLCLPPGSEKPVPC